MAGIRGTSRKKEQRGRLKKGRQLPHFQTVRFGGFDENQIICYLWDIIKSLEALREAGDGQEPRELAGLVTRLRRQIRVEIRRYFVRQRRRNVRTAAAVLTLILCGAGIFGILIGVERVAGNSMYPYLNHGDWIVYSRRTEKLHRNDVVVFEKNGEFMVKRIAGLPGDRVEISASGNQVVINGIQVREDYVTLTDESKNFTGKTDETRLGAPQTVMDGQYLVLGDNRSISIDSRDSRVGTVSEEEMRGRVLLVIRKNENDGDKK